MKSRRFALFAVLLIVIALAVSCGGENNNPRQMLTLALEPAVANPAPGARVQFAAKGTFDRPPSPQKLTPMSWLESSQDGMHAGVGVANVDQSGVAHCNATGTTWITAVAPSGALNKFGDPALVWGTARINCP